jgi:predicted transcriptional regulator
MLPKELRSRRILLGVLLDALGARVGIEPLLLANMESGEEPITSAVTLALEALERQRAESTNEQQ